MDRRRDKRKMMFFDQTNSLFTDFPLGAKWAALETVFVASFFVLIRFVNWCYELPEKFYAVFGKLAFKLGEAYAWVAYRAVNWYAYHFVQINQKHKCPACGIIEQHQIRFDSTIAISGKRGVIIHDCQNCKASWGELPIVPLERWLKLDRQGEIHVRE